MVLADQVRIGLMIDQLSLEGIFEEHKFLTPPAPTFTAFKYSVFALASHILEVQSNFNDLGKGPYGAPAFFSKAIELRQQMLSGRISLQNLQVSSLEKTSYAEHLTDFHLVFPYSGMTRSVSFCFSSVEVNTFEALLFSSNGLIDGI